MLAGMNDGLTFLLQMTVDLYVLMLILRAILQYRRAPYSNPICQAIIKLTDPVVKPFQKLIPGYKGIDLAIIVLIFVIEIIKLYALVGLKAGAFANPLGVGLWAVGGLINQTINVFFYSLVVRVILSWVSPTASHPVIDILYIVTEPLMSLSRRYIPPLSGIDFSPLAIIILLKLVAIMVANPILSAGMRLI